ncbi:MAG: ATP-dependent Clp protease proteolytic subunit [Aquabacterium sp.]
MNPFPIPLAAAEDKPAKGDKPEKNDRGSGLAEQLAFKSRFVLVFGEIDDKMARGVCERLILLSQDSDAPINLLVSSPGGHVESGDAIHDMIRFVRAPVTVIGTGWVASAATHLFLAAPKERRVCLPNTRFMIHQPAGGAGGRATDIAIQAKEIIKVRERISQVIALETGQPIEKVRIDMERDYWMSADEAIAYGIASRVIVNQKELG